MLCDRLQWHLPGTSSVGPSSTVRQTPEHLPSKQLATYHVATATRHIHVRSSTACKRKVQHGLFRFPSHLFFINRPILGSDSRHNIKPLKIIKAFKNQPSSSTTTSLLIYHQQPTNRQHEHRLRTQGSSCHPLVHHVHH